MATYRTRTAKDGTTSVQVQVRMAGHPAQGASFPNMREAKKWAATIEAAMVEGRHFKGTEGRKRTLGEAIDKYRLEVLPLKRNGSMYGFTLDWWKSNHGTRKVGEVSRGWLSDRRAELLAGKYKRATPGSKRSLYAANQPTAEMLGNHGTRLAKAYARTPATANRYMAALSSVFSHVCGDWEWLSPNANPFTGFGKLPEGKAKGQAYADAARVKLLQAAAEDPQLHRLIRVALGTAARASELLDLTWAHVELAETEGRLMFVDTKNGDTRIAWLFGDALAAVKEQRFHTAGALADPKTMTKPVFPGQWSHKRQRYGRYDYLPRLHAALERAGLKMSRPFHALRHTAATNAARMGANGHQLKALGGWKSNAVDTYVHMASEDTRQLAQGLAQRLLHNPEEGSK